MIDRDAILSDVLAAVDELADPHRHTEVIWDRDRHRNKRMSRAYSTTQDGLLKQLRDAAGEGLRVGDGPGGSAKPASKPPGAFEALCRHVFITVEVQGWVDALGVPRRATVEENLRALVGKAASLDDPMLLRLHSDVRYWRGQASAATGWTSLPYAPHAPCPVCGMFGTLRINRSTNAAYCINAARTATGERVCGATWAPGCIGPLAAHIRAYADGAA